VPLEFIRSHPTKIYGRTNDMPNFKGMN
jgi:hypothetical protein